jgi:hypothetical protein
MHLRALLSGTEVSRCLNNFDFCPIEVIPGAQLLQRTGAHAPLRPAMTNQNNVLESAKPQHDYTSSCSLWNARIDLQQYVLRTNNRHTQTSNHASPSQHAALQAALLHHDTFTT